MEIISLKVCFSILFSYEYTVHIKKFLGGEEWQEVITLLHTSLRRMSTNITIFYFIILWVIFSFQSLPSSTMTQGSLATYLFSLMALSNVVVKFLSLISFRMTLTFSRASVTLIPLLLWNRLCTVSTSFSTKSENNITIYMTAGHFRTWMMG